MATFEIKMPKLGESITEGTIISWSVKVGDTVEEDDVLFEVSTAKVSAEIPSPVEGKVKQLLFNEGDTVAVGTVVAILEIEGEGEDNGAQPETSEATQPKEKVPAPASEELSKNSQEEDRWYSPVVLQLAKAAGVSQDELDHIPGTGYLGRLSKKDIQTYIDHKNKGTEMPKPKQAPVSSMQQTATSTPTITVAPPTAPSMPMTAATPSAPLAQGDEVREMDRVRKIIADHMVLSKKVSPHVTSVIEVDVTRLVNWRKKVKDQFFKQEGINLTYMPAITEATAKALKAYPLVNSSVDGYNIILKKPINKFTETSKKTTGAEAAILRKEADLDLARLNLSYTVITAPYDGHVGRRTLEPGQYVQAGQTISYLVRDKDKWITANYKETQIPHIYIGQKVRIKVDALPGKIFNGEVTAISDATGSKYSLVPTDNSAGNFVKVQQRIPVRIDLENLSQEDTQYLRAGMMVETEALRK